MDQRRGATILIGAHQRVIASDMRMPIDAGYLADAVVLFRYFESKDEVRQPICAASLR